jgi:hypothetical protein
VFLLLRNGLIVNDSPETLRLAGAQNWLKTGKPSKGTKSGFHGSAVPDQPDQPGRRRLRTPGRASRRSWQQKYGIPGLWSRRRSPDEEETGPALEKSKFLVRQLLLRRSIIDRETLKGEHRGFSWSDLLPALRIMELSGELIGGKICEDRDGLQFAPANLSAVLSGYPVRDGWLWLHSGDPLLSAHRLPLSRRSGSYVLIECRRRSAEFFCSISGNGRSVVFFDNEIPAERIAWFRTFILEYLAEVNKGKAVTISKINGGSPADHPVFEDLTASGFMKMPSGELKLWKY